MPSKRRTEYKTRLLVLEGSVDDGEARESNAKVQNALNDPEMHKDGFELDQIVSLSRGNKFTNYIVILIVFSRAAQE